VNTVIGSTEGSIMLRAEPRPKDRRKVSIPDDLRESLREVLNLIEQAKYDRDIPMGYGDAIQVGSVCGGRIGEKARPFVLTYYPPEEPKNCKWFLTFHLTDIEDIADGRLTEITLYCCCTAANCTCKFREAKAVCSHCDYVADPDYAHLSGDEAMRRLEALGIHGLSSASTREQVLALLGEPQLSGGGVRDSLGYINPWVKYLRPDCQIRFEFGDNGQVVAVTFMPKDWTPGRCIPAFSPSRSALPAVPPCHAETWKDSER
jgi:hypothetical protein